MKRAGAKGHFLHVIRDRLSFSSDVRDLVETLNQDLVATDRMRSRVDSHPAGFVRILSARRLAMAEAYIKVANSESPEEAPMRLATLRHLAHYAFHTKTLSLPLNTARVQIALMKACVRARGDRVRQFELMHDFAVASHGQEAVIRRLLTVHGLLEVPDDGRKLADLDLAWDNHVHDSSSLGRKNPSHLLLDAFIKGISRLTVAYYDPPGPGVYEEVYEAAAILGIRVEVGTEFSVGSAYNRAHFMYIPPQDGKLAGLRAFLAQHEAELRPFNEALAANAAFRQDALNQLLEQFNTVHLPQWNHRYAGIPQLEVPRVTWEDVRRAVPAGRVSRAQVGYVLSEAVGPVLHKRVLYLRNQLEHALFRQRQGGVSQWEVEHLRKQHEEALRDFQESTPFRLQERYVSRGTNADRDSALPDVAALAPLFERAGGRVVMIHPLSVGLAQAVQLILEAHPWLTDIETFNMSDVLRRDPADLRRLNRLVDLLNRGAVDEIVKLLADAQVEGIDPALVEAACATFSQRHLRPSCGSDYIGGHPDVPGMGFVSSIALSKRILRTAKRNGHGALPESIARLLLAKGGDTTSLPEDAQVLFVSKRQHADVNELLTEAAPARVTPLQFWRYLNPTIRLAVKAMIAFVPAYLMVGPWYASLWLGITAFRNIMADVISSSGMLVRAWTLTNVDRDNLGNSILWTGFSVPILTLANHGFNLAAPELGLVEGEFLHKLVRFWVIAFANGLYISSHNRLRGFPASVIRVNFFRTVLSWPLATLASYGMGPLGIPPIVQSKIWSDVVAGLIEGTGKYTRRIRLRERDLLELLHTLHRSPPATVPLTLLDILFVWAVRDGGRPALGRLLRGPDARHLLRSKAERSAVDAEVLRSAHDMLLREFGSEGSIERLTCTVLEHFQGSEAEILCHLIGERHDEFLAWLKTFDAPAGHGHANGNGNGRKPLPMAA
jgi:hypothetical protein